MSMLKIIDSVSSAPIVGAKVYVTYSSGTMATLTADSLGLVSLAADVASLTIKASGYGDLRTSTSSGTVLLTSTSVATSLILFSVEPTSDQTGLSGTSPSAGAQISISNLDGFLEGLTVGLSGTILTSGRYAPGTY